MLPQMSRFWWTIQNKTSCCINLTYKMLKFCSFSTVICGNRGRFRAKGHKIKVVGNTILKTFCFCKAQTWPFWSLCWRSELALFSDSPDNRRLLYRYPAAALQITGGCSWAAAGYLWKFISLNQVISGIFNQTSVATLNIKQFQAMWIFFYLFEIEIDSKQI